MPRCLIPECETSETAKLQFIPSWIQDAVPFRDSEPWKCKRYKPLANTTFHHPEECIVSFSPEEVENCKEWVFATDEVTIVNEVSSSLSINSQVRKMLNLGAARWVGVYGSL